MVCRAQLTRTKANANVAIAKAPAAENAITRRVRFSGIAKPLSAATTLLATRLVV
jgi:hypothetical protein